MSSRSSTRDRDIRAILDAFTELPDTPDHASPRDLQIVTDILDRGVPALHVLRAIRLGAYRRWARDNSAGSLPPVKSFAYFKRVLDGLSDHDLRDDYSRYIEYRLRDLRPDSR